MLSFASRESLNFRRVESSSALLVRARNKARRAPIAPAQPAAPVATGLTRTRTDGPTERVCMAPHRRSPRFPERARHSRRVRCLGCGPAPRRVLELDGLTMIDSSGAIVSLFKRVKASGGAVDIKGVSGQPLAICKLGLHVVGQRRRRLDPRLVDGVCLPRRAGTFGVADRAGIAGHDTRAARGVVSG